MALNPNLEEQAMVADVLTREGTHITLRESVVEAVVGVGFVAACAVIWLLDPPGAFAPAPALLCLAVLVVASNVRFETPFGFTVATQLAFVPMLFAVPVAVGPIAAFVAVAASGLFRVLAGKAPPSRLLLTLGNSWFPIGPAAVFAVAGTEPRDAGAVCSSRRFSPSSRSISSSRACVSGSIAARALLRSSGTRGCTG
jgi:hypothetical protein